MASLNLIERATISISAKEIQVELASGKAEFSPDGLDSMIRALEGVRHMVLGGQAGFAKAETGTVAAPAERAEVRERKRRAEPTTAADDGGAGKKKRRSRKRVGDALVSWMEENPGWHTEEQLLKAVIDNRMTDANPKRALKIALGKQRGDIFDGDGEGHWKLISDRDAGEAPRPAKVAKKARNKRAKLAAPGAGSRSPRKTRLRTRATKSGDDAPDDAIDDDKPANESAGASRPVLVKRGQERKAKPVATPKTVESTRWGRASANDVERARKNLLGLGPRSPKATSGS